MFSVPEQTLGKYSGPSASVGDWPHDSYRHQNSGRSSRSRKHHNTLRLPYPLLAILTFNQLQVRLVESYLWLILQKIRKGRVGKSYESKKEHFMGTI